MAETLGPYTLDKRIGAGGMADVFLARGPRGVCVVKRPHENLCANPDFVRMFLDEAAILASLRHPNIAEIFDLGQVGGAYYLAMEYVPGFDLMTISLEHERQGELIAPELCARIVADVASALHSAHEAKHPRTGQALNLIHRDVTPHNVLLSTSGVVKLIDFGVARAAIATHRTQAGLVKGKYPYMAPEQITGQDIDRRVDVFACGLLIYELLTNTRAIAGNTEVEQIDNARVARIRPIEQLRANLPVPLRQIFASCVHPDREGRYPTALALKEDLEKYLRFVGQPIGQEDLLRLFRVVAAEVPHLEPGPPPPPLALVVAKDTWAGASTDLEVPSNPGADPEQSLGFAPTAPSMRIPRLPSAMTAPKTPSQAHAPLAPTSLIPSPRPPPPSQQSTSVLPDRARAVKAALEDEAASEQTIPATSSSLKNWVVLSGLAVVVIVAVGLLVKPTGGGPVAARPVDARPPLVVAPMPVFDAGAEAAPIDSGVLALERGEGDAGGDDDAPAPSIGPDDRAASLEVGADLPVDVSSSGHLFGKAPVKLELVPGDHKVIFTNVEVFFRRVIEVHLEPGDAKSFSLRAGPKGSLVIKCAPIANIFINGQPAGTTAYKEVDLYEGVYVVKIDQFGKVKTRQVKVSAGNVVTANFEDS